MLIAIFSITMVPPALVAYCWALASTTSAKTERINKKKQLTVYETDIADNSEEENKLQFEIGDKVYHPKHGKGTVEGFANYSNKILFCQIEFEKVGRRILDPRIAGLEKIN